MAYLQEKEAFPCLVEVVVRQEVEGLHLGNLTSMHLGEEVAEMKVHLPCLVALVEEEEAYLEVGEEVEVVLELLQPYLEVEVVEEVNHSLVLGLSFTLEDTDLLQA